MTGKQLRNSILQWAIQGKLVPQDPNDEPASVLLERIRAEKARLVKEKKIKRDKNETIIYRGEDNSYYEKTLATGDVKCIDDEIPFDIPQNWEWCRMKDVFRFINGRAYKKDELQSNGKYKVLRVGNFFTNNEWYYSDLELPSEKYCNRGDLLYAWSASFGPQIWEGDKTIFHYHIWNVDYSKKNLFREYLFYFLLFDKTQVLKSTTGSTMIHVSMENMNPRLIPIPPLEEQKRIASRIETLLPLIDIYEGQKHALDLINNSIAGNLYKSILQEAIQGRLVPQIESEGTAEELLEEIRTEKKRLVKEGKLKKSAIANESRIFRGDDNKYYEQIGSIISCIDDQIPFEIPASWNWIRLGEFVSMNMGKTPPRGEQAYWSSGIYPWVSISDMVDGGKILNTREKISEIAASHIFHSQPSPKGSLLMSFKLTIGKISILDVDAYHNEAIVTINPFLRQDIVSLYLMTFLPMLSLQGDSKDAIKGMTLNSKSLYNILLPLPPLKEVSRIISKVKIVSSKI